MVNEKPIVLIVEDDHNQSDIMKEIINSTNLYQNITAYNGTEALQAIEKHERGFGWLTNRIACILLDWQMPKMSGEQLLVKLRDNEHYHPFKRNIPIVVISAHDDHERRKLAEHPRLGLVSAYLSKPFEADLLTHVLYRIVYEKEAEVLREMLIEQRLQKLEKTFEA